PPRRVPPAPARPPAPRRPPAPARAAALLRRLDHERGAALTSFVTARESSRAGAVEKHLEELCGAPPVTGRAERRVHELVPKLLERPWQDLRAAAKRARGAAVEDGWREVRRRWRRWQAGTLRRR
ncbi:MAG TPA: hypothetical protein VMD59_04700, partial [Acidimicrobiales bacterium]|nr:hypothetical protein [Acidimicrobiales bacterium]